MTSYRCFDCKVTVYAMGDVQDDEGICDYCGQPMVLLG